MAQVHRLTTVPVWRASEADALEAKAEAIEFALDPLRRLDGIFEGDRRHEHRCYCDQLALDAENMRNAAQKLRQE